MDAMDVDITLVIYRRAESQFFLRLCHKICVANRPSYSGYQNEVTSSLMFLSD